MEMKRTYLLELVEYISQSKHWFSEDCVPVILEMIGNNLFRSLPPPVYEDFDPEEDEPNFDPSWPHLQFVYEFFHRFDGRCMSFRSFIRKAMNNILYPVIYLNVR